MSITIQLSESLIEQAEKYAAINFRPVSKQIEYWSVLGRIADENPDLPLSFIKETLLSLEEVKLGHTTTFSFREE